MTVRLAGIVCLVVSSLIPAAAAYAQGSAPPAPDTIAAAGTDPVRPGTWTDTLQLFAGLDGSKQPQDLGINANMGVRVSAALGVPLVTRAGLALEGGVGLNASDAAVHVLEQIEGTSRRTQLFLTLGLVERLRSGFSWSLGTDVLVQSYYDRFTLAQLRGEVAQAVGATDEVGVWFAHGLKNDRGLMGDTTVTLSPVSQGSAFLRHRWPTGARTTAWVGLAEGHNNIVFVFDNDTRSSPVLVYGAALEMPLSDRISVTGAAGFLTPAATGTVDAYLGLTFFPGGSAPRTSRAFAQPALGPANNPRFAVDLAR